MVRRALLVLAFSMMVAACSDEAVDGARAAAGGGAGGSGGAGGGVGGSPLPVAIADHAFGPFEAWASPIEDYKAVGEAELPGKYDPGIGELAPFGDRLWLGYGDGNYNMGTYTPIEFRFFASATDPAHAAALVEAAGEGAPQDVPTRSGEEAIDRYRYLDGALWQAGVDSIDADELWTQANTDPKGIEGNAYVLGGDVWEKDRSIVGGEHVHDFASRQGAVYGVGSGADLRSEFEAGQIFRYLWKTADGGETFTTVERIQHPTPGAGDTRWVHLLSTSQRLFLFGYESDFAAGSASIRNAVYDAGAATTALGAGDDLAEMFALGTLPLPDGTGLVHGVDVGGATLRYALWQVAAEGAVAPIDLAGAHVLDLALNDATAELLYLVAPGDAYPADDPSTWELSVLVAPAATPAAWVAIASYSGAEGARAIAFWQHALFLGTSEGHVLKAALAP